MTQGEHLAQRREPGKWASIGLAAFVHLALVMLLFFSIRWQNRAPEAVEVDLFRAPAAPPAAARPASPPEPAAQPTPRARPEPKPEPKPTPPPKPDIALKDKDKPKPPPKEAPKPAPRPEPDMRRKLVDEQLQRETEQLSRQRLQQEAEREATALREGQAAAAAGRTRAAWSDKIGQKIRGNIVEPPGVVGNPKANFLVSLLPDGSVLAVKMRKSTGNPALDAAIERAINKSSPLPKPDDPAAFERELILEWSLKEE